MGHPKVLVTGSCGYLGTEIVSTLLKWGCNVVAVDSLRYNQHLLPIIPQLIASDDEYAGTYEFHKIDVRNHLAVAKLASKCDVIIPLAALVGMSICNKYPDAANEINYDAIRHLVSFLSHSQYIIFPNTNSFYGSAGADLCTEETPGNPLSIYAKTKYAAECEILDRHEKSIVLRLATVFGTSLRTRLDLLVNNLAYDAYFGGKLTCFEGHVRRNFVHVADVAWLFASLIVSMKCQFSGVFNFGNDSLNMSKSELIQLIATYFDVDVVEIDGYDMDRRDYNVSSKKLLDTTGFQATIGIIDGLRQLREWFELLPNDLTRTELLRFNRNE